jgi:hypothetical protein
MTSVEGSRRKVGKALLRRRAERAGASLAGRTMNSKDVATLLKDLDKVEWDAYQHSVHWRPKQLADFLVERIGLQMTAMGTGLGDGRPVRSWQAETAQPRPVTLERLRLLFRVAHVIDRLYGPETARAFLRSATRFLGNRAPLEVIADDDLDEAQPAVLGAVRGFLEQ